MKEWLEKMAKLLGLPVTASQDEVLAKLSDRFEELSKSGDNRVAGIAAQLAAVGCKIEKGDKIVKLDTTPRNPEDVAKIAALELEGAKSRLAAGKATVEALLKAGKIPPAMKEKLDRVFATTGRMETIQLGKGENDSEVLIKGSVDILADLRDLFNAIPAVTGNKLSTVGGQPADDKDTKEAGSLGRAVAERRKSGYAKKKEPAAK